MKIVVKGDHNMLKMKRISETYDMRVFTDEGDYFGDIELVRGGKSIANVRAGPEGPVELLLLSREHFNHMLAESPLTQEAISNMVQERLKEHKVVNRRSRRRLFG